MKTINIAAFIVAVSLLISLLSGLNQLTGFFSKISLPTAILSLIIAIIVALFFPILLRTKLPENKTILRMSFRVFSIVLAVVVVIVGIGPFLGKYVMAAQSMNRGEEYIDANLYSAARVELNRAADYFKDLGFNGQAVDAKLILIQAYTGVGNYDRANELIKEIEAYANLSMHQEGKLNGIRGNIAYGLGEFEQAERFYQMARTTIEPDSQAEAIILANQAVLWSGKGAPYRARVLDNYQRARRIYEEYDDTRGLIDLLINEGCLYENDPEKAMSVYEEAMNQAEKLDDSYIMGVIFQNIGVTYRQQGDLVRAEELYQQAILKFEEVADLSAQAEVMANLATLEIVRGRNELARQYLQASEAYFRNVDLTGELVNMRKIAQILTTQADIYDCFGESETSEKYYQEALTIYQQHPDPIKEAETIINYAGLLVHLNQIQEARNQLERSREIIEAYSGEEPNQCMGVLYSVLGKVYQDTGDFTNALVYYEKAINVFEILEDSLHYAQAIENRGLILVIQNDVKGMTDVTDALGIYRELENRDLEVKALFNLYLMYDNIQFYKFIGEVPDSVKDLTVADLLEDIFKILDSYNVNQETEAGILFGILVQDIGGQAELIVYRERLLQLKVFYEERDESIGLGRSLVKLANIEQALHNWDKMEEYARAAEVYADQIPFALRIPYHTDLGFFLVIDFPEDGLDHFFQAFDAAQAFAPEYQLSLAFVIKTYILSSLDEIDHDKYLTKAKYVLNTTDDAEVRNIFEEIVESL
jgi:tetratricopeptide (TPR) repeat protein